MAARAPRVTVLLPVYNGEAFLGEALHSILEQSFSDFELLLINDGSTDDTAVMIQAYASHDERVRVINHKANLGLIACLNEGLTLARGEYIARMDADDISVARRLATQVKFMDSHPAIGVCGSWIETMGEGRARIQQYPIDDAWIRSLLLFHSTLAHPSVIMRRELLATLGLAYDPTARHAEDYELWVRAAPQIQFANLPEVLLRYRVHPQQVGQRVRREQQESTRRIHRFQLEQLGLSPTPAELDLHGAMGTMVFQPSVALLQQAEQWFLRLLEANARVGYYPEPTFSTMLRTRWYTLCRLSTALGPWVWQRFWNSVLCPGRGVGWGRLVKFGALAMLRRGSSLKGAT